MVSFFIIRSFVAAVTFSVLAQGSTIDVNGISYYASTDVVATIPNPEILLKSAVTAVQGSDLVPLTVIDPGTNNFTAEALQSIVQAYIASDDVFNAGFLQVIYLKNSTVSSNTKPTGYGTKVFLQSSFNDSTKDIPIGPYFVSTSTGNVFQAYRLYSDVQGAFTEGVIEKSDGTFDVLPAAIPGAQSPTIGVLSRLYYTPSDTKPLAGVRLGIKDIYDIAGLKTSCGNRAYYNLYPERNVTATAVQRLIDAGAVIVGKMKTSQFANGETATADWVDYHSPFNARGDGYQDPSSSSSGPGAGIGAYTWLDLALGSDTGGSVRNPAQVNGAFGNRPSHGLVPLDNVMPLSPALDTAGFLCRDATLWKKTAGALYQTNITFGYTEFPQSIYTSGFPDPSDPTNTEAEKVLLSFLSKLQTFLSATVSAIDYNALWNETGPVNEVGSLSTFLNIVYPTLISQQQYSQFTIPFYNDYAAANNGRKPFIDPSPLIRWTWGQNNISSTTATEEAITNKTIFMNWFNDYILPRSPPTTLNDTTTNNSTSPTTSTCSESLFLYPGTLATPTYRNVYRSAPGIPTGFSVSRISNFAEVPDMVVPIGQAAYNSSITGQVEYLPVAVDILAAKGCDGMVFELVEALQMAGIVRAVGTGSTLYSGDDEILM